MSRSHGTGQPLRFKCSKQRRARRSGRAHECWRTGKVRPARARIGGIRVMDHEVEYECATCGHVGWSRHVEAGQLPVALCGSQRAMPEGYDNAI